MIVVFMIFLSFYDIFVYILNIVVAAYFPYILTSIQIYKYSIITYINNYKYNFYLFSDLADAFI